MDQEQNAVEIQEPIVEQASTEKMVQMPQHKLDEIIKHAKRDAEEKGKRLALEHSSSLGGMQQMSQSDLIEMATQHALQKLREESQAEQERQMHEMYRKQGEKVAQDFISKIESNKERLPGIDKAVKELALDKVPHIIHLLNEVDNTADVLNDIRNNPQKLATLDYFFSKHGYDLARSEMQKLSQSLKANEAAAHVKTAQKPLSQIQASTVGTDNGSMTIRDYKKQPWLKG